MRVLSPRRRPDVLAPPRASKSLLRPGVCAVPPATYLALPDWEV